MAVSLLLAWLPVAAPPLNVLMIGVDDLRPELHPWGFDTIQTPSIDAFADDNALVFTEAHVQQAVCSPSRTSLLTSRRPDHTRVYDLDHHFRDMGLGLRGVTTLPEYFKLRGYASVGMGKIFHPVPDKVTGLIDDWCTPTMHNCSWTAMASKGGQPYFHGRLEKYYQNGNIDPSNSTCLAGPCHSAVDGPTPAACPTRGTCGCPSYAAIDTATEERCPMPGNDLAEHAASTIARLAARGADNPFFLAVGFHKPHLPFIVPQRYLDLYPTESIELAPNPSAPAGMPDIAWSPYGEIRAQYYDIRRLNLTGDYNSTRNDPNGKIPGDDMPDDVARQLRRHYRAAVSFTDANIGTVLDALAASPAANNTVVAIWGDHGWQLGEHGAWCKQTMWEIATRGVLMIKTPLIVPATRTTRALVEFVDIMPTLADLAGLEVPAQCPKQGLGSAAVPAACTDGMSVKALWAFPDKVVKPRALSLYPRPNMNNKQAMGYSMVKRVNGSLLRYTEWVNITAVNLSLQMFIPNWETGGIGLELYNHTRSGMCFGCLENINIVANVEHKALVRSLSAELRQAWS